MAAAAPIASNGAFAILLYRFRRLLAGNMVFILPVEYSLNEAPNPCSP